MPIVNAVQNQRNTPALYTNTLANQPAAGFTGRIFISQDTFAFYRDNGIGWDLIGGPGTGTITGAGTAGKLTKFTGAAVIADSIVTESGAALTVAGTLTATSLIKSGGTSAQFLKADGSIDSSTYIVNAGFLAGQILFGQGTNAGGSTSLTYDNVTGYLKIGLAITSTANVQSGGSIEALSFIKTGGTSAQFLKADGSIDANTYLPAGSVSGTAGTIVKFLTSNTLGNSILTESGAALAVAGTLTATSLIKSGGTSSQFLKADGSIDSSTYLTAAGAVTSITGTANQVIRSSATGAVTLSLPQSIATTSNVTFAGGIFTDTVIITGTTSNPLRLNGRASDNLTGIVFQSNAGAEYGQLQVNSSNNFLFYNTSSTVLLLTLGTSGAVFTGIAKATRFIGNSAADNGVDTIQSGGGSVIGNIYRAEGTIQATSATITASATHWNDNTNGSTVTYTLPNSVNLAGAYFLFSKTGTGTLTLSGSIITIAGASVASVALTSLSGMKFYYYNGTNYYQLN